MLKISKYGWVLITFVSAIAIAIALVPWTAEEVLPIAAPGEETVILPPPIIIEVDGVGCVIAESPTLTYYVATDSVRVTIECDSDILMHYLPAVEAVESKE